MEEGVGSIPTKSTNESKLHYYLQLTISVL